MAQLALPKRWVYPLLLFFVLFFILTSPQTAGPQARDFFSWVGDLGESVGTFFDGLFSEP